jgi:uracil-DNA glycosylase
MLRFVYLAMRNRARDANAIFVLMGMIEKAGDIGMGRTSPHHNAVIDADRTHTNDSDPGSLASKEVRARRRAMLSRLHVAQLHAFVERLQADRRANIPTFDPLDGGAAARALFLFEAPDENAAASGFMSRDNHGSTAAALTANMRQADLPRHMTCLWSVVPWGKHGQAQDLVEIVAGVECLKELLIMLPAVEVIMLVGNRARRAQRHLLGVRPTVLTSLHPSLLVQNRFPEKAAKIPLSWARVHEFLGSQRSTDRG